MVEGQGRRQGQAQQLGYLFIRIIYCTQVAADIYQIPRHSGVSLHLGDLEFLVGSDRNTIRAYLLRCLLRGECADDRTFLESTINRQPGSQRPSKHGN